MSHAPRLCLTDGSGGTCRPVLMGHRPSCVPVVSNSTWYSVKVTHVTLNKQTNKQTNLPKGTQTNAHETARHETT
eukprot:2256742-Prymnesium_polylepis.1